MKAAQPQLVLLVSLGLFALSANDFAQTATDGSLGPKQSSTSLNSTFPANLGQTRGQNLFHSFSDFNIPAGGSATFTGPASIKNVLARVTGGRPSQINGRLACDIPSANLYLI